MSKILDLRQKRSDVWDKAKAFLDERSGENGLMSGEDTATYERMEQEVVDLGHAIERAFPNTSKAVTAVTTFSIEAGRYNLSA